MKIFLCVAAVLALWVAPNAAVDCSHNKCSERGQVQTLCRYTNPNPTSACGQVHRVGLTEAEKTEVVNRHNELRAYVAAGKETRGAPGPQPPAANMQRMQWDDELAEVAQRWANQCQFGHDQCRDVDRFQVGQNVASRMTSGQDNWTPKDQIQMWYDEVTKFNRNQVNRLTTITDVGHYTQLVWATSNRIGCGQVRYNANGWNNYYFVCNYGPTGNWMGQPIYQIK